MNIRGKTSTFQDLMLKFGPVYMQRKAQQAAMAKHCERCAGLLSPKAGKHIREVEDTLNVVCSKCAVELDESASS